MCIWSCFLCQQFNSPKVVLKLRARKSLRVDSGEVQLGWVTIDMLDMTVSLTFALH